MSDAPERIWVLFRDTGESMVFTDDGPHIPAKFREDVPYVRADEYERLRAEVERLKKLAESAFNEGFGAGMDEFTKSRGGVTWYDSRSRAALTQHKDTKGDTL